MPEKPIVTEIAVKNQQTSEYEYADIGSSADKITYDNSSSQLEGETVQVVIDEINTKIGNKSTVSVTPTLVSGTEIAGIAVDGVETKLYAPNGGGGGDTVSWTQLTQSGTKIAEIDINGTSTDVYAPTSGGGGASWTDVTGTLTAGQTEITLNNSAIHEDSTFDFYTSKFGINPTNVELTIQKIKVLRQELVTQESDLDVTVTANTNWSGYDPWKAFFSNSSSGCWIGSGGDPHWLQVEFNSATSIQEMDFVSSDSNRSHAISRVGYSNDGINFTECGILSSTMINNIGHCELDNDYEAKYFRIYFDGSYTYSYYPCMSQLEIYGYDEDPQEQKSITLTFDAQSTNIDVKVRITNDSEPEPPTEIDLTPRMTGYTSTAGTVSAVNSYNQNFLAWHSMASDTTYNANYNGGYWAGGSDSYLQFDFNNNVHITKVGFAAYLGGTFTLQSSTDGTTYTDVQDITITAQGNTTNPIKENTILTTPITSCNSIRLVGKTSNKNIGALHIYGWEV